MSSCFNHICRVLICLGLMLATLSGSALAASKKSAPRPSLSYDEWLSNLGAIDVMAWRLAQTGQSPEVLLERAGLLLRSGNPERVIELLGNMPPFVQSELEQRRLLLLAQAQRGLGRVKEAADFYVLALRTMSKDQALESVKESGVTDILRTAWVDTYWNSVFQLNSAAEPYLEHCLDLAGQLSLKAPFWKNVQDMSSRTGNGFEGEAHDMAKEFQQMELVPEDRSLVMRVLGAVALRKWSLANSILAEMTSTEMKLFWQDVIFRLKSVEENSKADQNLLSTDATSLEALGYVKAASFMRSVLPRLETLTPGGTAWAIVLPDAAEWKEVAKDLHGLQDRQALGYLFRKAGLTDNPRDKARLYTLSFAYALLVGDQTRAATDWSDMDQLEAPLSLKIAATLMFKFSARQLTERIPSSTEASHLLVALCSAAGHEIYPLAAAPFWVRMGLDDLPLALEVWPVDKQLGYAGYREDWNKTRSLAAARRLALAYPLAYQVSAPLMTLARSALSGNRPDVAEYLAGQCHEAEVPTEVRSDYYRLAAARLYRQGRSDEAVEAYRKYYAIFDLDAEPHERLKIVDVAQRRGWWDFSAQVLKDILARADELSPQVRAETIRRLGDVEAARGQIEAALEHYLHLGWSLPGEAATHFALLKAASIYQDRAFSAQAIALLRIVAKDAPISELKNEALSRLDLLDALPVNSVKTKAKPEPAKPVRTEILYPF